jgi:hypothetical protein
VVILLVGIFGWCSRLVGLPYSGGVCLSAALISFSGTLLMAACCLPGVLDTYPPAMERPAHRAKPTWWLFLDLADLA